MIFPTKTYDYYSCFNKGENQSSKDVISLPVLAILYHNKNGNSGQTEFLHFFFYNNLANM